MHLCFKFYIKYLNLLFNFGLALNVELLLEEKKTENKSEWTPQSTYQSQSISNSPSIGKIQRENAQNLYCSCSSRLSKSLFFFANEQQLIRSTVCVQAKYREKMLKISTVHAPADSLNLFIFFFANEQQLIRSDELLYISN